MKLSASFHRCDRAFAERAFNHKAGQDLGSATFYLKFRQFLTLTQHLAHPACEYAGCYSQQHGLLVYLKPDLGSQRRLGEQLLVENVNVGDIAIIPVFVNHWQAIQLNPYLKNTNLPQKIDR